MAKKTYRYEPDYAVAPGATLKESLEEKGISQTDLATRTGMAEKTISQIINGVAPISYDTAEKLELALGIPSRFWNRRELSYREALAKIAARERLDSELDWLKSVPVTELRNRGALKKDEVGADLVRSVLMFFGVSSVDAWREVWGNPAAQYRGRSVQEKKPGFVSAWLRLGDLQSQHITTEPFDGSEFRRSLLEVRQLTRQPASEWQRSLPELCAASGVAVVFTREIPRASISGATRWLTKDKALIQLSLKYKTDDHLWFTFFHEAGHILLHGKKMRFLEFRTKQDDNEEERQASDFARDMLIPPTSAHMLGRLRTRRQICDFAESIGISKGIVVGRMQHDDYLRQGEYSDLKTKLSWVKNAK